MAGLERLEDDDSACQSLGDAFPHTRIFCEMEELVDFDQAVREAIDLLPRELDEYMSNVAIVVEAEPPGGAPLLGLYEGYPLTRRSSGYVGVPPDKISIYQGPIERLYGADPERLRAEIRRVVLHEIAHHFGISDERLHELDRY